MPRILSTAKPKRLRNGFVVVGLLIFASSLAAQLSHMTPEKSPKALIDKAIANAASPDPVLKQTEKSSVDAAASKVDAELEKRIDGFVEKMSLDEKIGQLLFLGFGGTVMDSTIEKFLREKKPGAVALFSRNIKHLGQTMRLIREVRKSDPAGIPMFVSVDQEGGNVVRLKRHVTLLPSAMALGAARDVDLSHRVGVALGKDLRLLGFNMNLAPVLDVNSNPKNPVIGTRSFGENPQLVGELGAAYIRGLQSQGVSAIAKHFPGHGDTSTDSHFALPQLDHTRERLDTMELVPFKWVMEHTKLDGLMTAHIALPKIVEEKGMPATVSHNVLTKILREELGYRGLLVTDGLEMAGIVKKYGSGEAAVRAINAGADMVMVLWFPEKKNEVQRSLYKAVKSGRITKARLDQSVRRILRTKFKRGLFEHPEVNVEESAKILKSEKVNVALEVAKSAMTLVSNRDNLFPIAKSQKVVVASTEPAFLKEMKKRIPGAVVLPLKVAPTKSQLRSARDLVLRRAKGADAIILGVLDGRNLQLPDLVRQRARNVPVGVVNFGSPYAFKNFGDVDAVLCAFGFRWASEYAAALVVSGELAPRGSLPVTIDDKHRYGHGLRYSNDM